MIYTDLACSVDLFLPTDGSTVDVHFDVRGATALYIALFPEYTRALEKPACKAAGGDPGTQTDAVTSYEYDAFGNLISAENIDNSNPFRYCGEYWDDELGCVYLRARY